MMQAKKEWTDRRKLGQKGLAENEENGDDLSIIKLPNGDYEIIVGKKTDDNVDKQVYENPVFADEYAVVSDKNDKNGILPGDFTDVFATRF